MYDGQRSFHFCSFYTNFSSLFFISTLLFFCSSKLAFGLGKNIWEEVVFISLLAFFPLYSVSHVVEVVAAEEVVEVAVIVVVVVMLIAVMITVMINNNNNKHKRGFL